MDQKRVSVHCQTAAHYINYTTMTKMNDAASGVKKRGIDLVNDDENEITKEKNLQEAEITLEEPVVKRIKLEDEKTNEMEDTNEQLPQLEIKASEIKEEVDNKSEECVVEPVVTAITSIPRGGRGNTRGRYSRGVARRGRR